MKHLLALLIVTVLTGGGPALAKPSRLEDGVVTVTNSPQCGVVTGYVCNPPPSSVIASSRSGKVKVRVRPGVYFVSAALLPPDVTPGQTCEEKPVRVRRGRTTRVYLYCSIK